jgi:hypothetical protein
MSHGRRTRRFVSAPQRATEQVLRSSPGGKKNVPINGR